MLYGGLCRGVGVHLDWWLLLLFASHTTSVIRVVSSLVHLFTSGNKLFVVCFNLFSFIENAYTRYDFHTCIV